MKFNARTIQILRNFSTINESLIFKPGNQLKTISQTKTIMARANIDQAINSTFAIFDLPQFMSAVSMFEDPELTPNGSVLTISRGTEKLNYTLSEPSLILSPPEKELVLEEPEVEFELKNEVLTRTLKALGIIGAPEFAITGDGSKVYVEAINTKNSSGSNYRVEVGETTKRFRFIFVAENMKLLPGDYHVSIAAKGLSHFKSDDVEYWIALESHSTYQG